MQHITLHKSVIILLIFFSIQNIFSQDEYNPWIIGIGVNAIDYFPVTGIDNNNPDGFMNEIFNAEDHWNVSGARIHATRYLTGHLSADLSLTFNQITKVGDNIVDKAMYVATDFNIHLSILNPENSFVPYLLAGGGYTSVFTGGGTVNLGAGLNYWFSDAIGANVQGMYKYNSPDYSLLPHFYYSFGLVYKPNAIPTRSKAKRYKWNRRRKFLWRNGF